jgi:hypothetical protein
MKKETRDNFIEKKKKKTPSQAIVSLSMIKNFFYKIQRLHFKSKKEKEIYISGGTLKTC